MGRLQVSALAVLGLLLTVGVVGVAQAQSRKPLLVPGKKTLYQRVLSRPGAVLLQRPGRTRPAEPVLPFTVFYVYARENHSGNEWLEAGMQTHGRTRGWIDAKQLIPWKQALTAAFREPLGHDRVLLFREREPLKQLIDARDLVNYHRLYREAEAGRVSENSPVIAIQPKAHVDIHEDFYLVPILQHEDVFLDDQQALLLQVASVPLVEEVRPAAPKDYRSGLVFVIDSTLSMGPYIDRTRQAVRKVYDTIQRAGLREKVSFGLIAYRDSIRAVPKLGYLTRTYATLAEGLDPEGFFQRVKDARPSRASSRGFIEDAYAGVKTAIEEIDWRGYDARYIVLITDAGARTARDPLGETGMNAEALRQLAQDQGVAIWVLHLLTPIGKRNHRSAGDQYRRLSYYPRIGNFYYGVGVGNVDEFGRVLESLAGQITEQVRETARGIPPRPIREEASGGSPLAQFQRKVARLGNALRMRYVQKVEGTRAPSVFNAWLVDRDFRDPTSASLEVRVLLSRDQLSDLQYVLRQVLETAEEGILSPRSFINDLKSLAATIARDPASVAGSTRTTGVDEQSLADLGYMREYLEDLPYSSEVMGLSLERWEEWPAREQLAFIHRLESKVNYYQALHDHTDLWVSLGGGSVTGDSVFPVALELLP